MLSQLSGCYIFPPVLIFVSLMLKETLQMGVSQRAAEMEKKVWYIIFQEYDEFIFIYKTECCHIAECQRSIVRTSNFMMINDRESQDMHIITSWWLGEFFHK
jgi:hypothetical protein